jgi:DNA-binding protein HU-beta
MPGKARVPPKFRPLSERQIKLNISELVDRVAAEHGVSRDHARKIIDSALAIITGTTNAGAEVNLAGFGRFKIADRAARSGRNPATGETIEIPASRKLTFSPAKAVRDVLNSTASEAKAAAD